MGIKKEVSIKSTPVWNSNCVKAFFALYIALKPSHISDITQTWHSLVCVSACIASSHSEPAGKADSLHSECTCAPQHPQCYKQNY